MKALYFILTHAFFISICAVALALQTYFTLNIEVNYWVLAFIFFSTLTSYNTYWLLSQWKFNNNDSAKKIIAKNDFKIVFLVIASVFVIFSFTASPINIAVLIPAIILNCFYILPLLKYPSISIHKNIGFLKTVLLAFTWAYVTVCLPINKSIFQLNLTQYWLFINRFTIMLILCVIFDKRDVAVDKIKGLYSIASQLTPKYLHFFVLLFFMLNFVSVFFLYNHSWQHLISLLLNIGITGIVYLLSAKRKDYLFYYFYVDGVMIFCGLTSLVAHLFSK